jgi:hypothetical protein
MVLSHRKYRVPAVCHITSFTFLLVRFSSDFRQACTGQAGWIAFPLQQYEGWFWSLSACFCTLQRICIAEGTRSFSEFTVTVRKDSISEVAKHFYSCRRREIFWITNWLVGVTIDPVTALWWRSTEPRDWTHVYKLSKWDWFCPYECLPKYLCTRGHIMKWKSKVQRMEKI